MPYNYNWNGTGAQPNATLTGVSAGTVNVTITDANCSATATFSITEPTAVVITPLNQTNVSCFGGNNGAVNLSASGGTSPYTFSWSNGATTQNVSLLSAGIYSVVITDNNNCTYSVNAITVSQPAAVLNETVTATNDVSCNAGNNGSITLSVITTE